MTPTEFLVAAQQVVERWPDAVIVKNPVGNLSVVVDGVMVAWVDLMNGEVDDLSDSPTTSGDKPN